MIKKILTVILKIIAGLFLFYLVLGFIILPLVLLWGIPSQGTKILKTPVHVKGVSFNPIFLDLSIKGLEVLDVKKQVMIGFDQFRVNVSFLSLIKKAYRVEVIELNGLKVNVELLANGKINLLDLVPSTSGADVPSKEKVQTESLKSSASAEVQKPAKAEPLPLVFIDSISLRQGAVHFTDRTINPTFSTSLSQMNLSLTGVSTKPDSKVKMNFESRLGDKGTMAIQALISPFATPLQLETDFTMNNYALNVLTPYVGKYTGQALKDGKLDLKMEYQIIDNQLVARHKVLVQHFEFGQPVESKDALRLPFGLAVALLEDPQGRINITLPVHGDMSDPKFEYFHLIGQVIKNFFIKLVTKPFTMLASIVGTDNGTDEMGTIRFLPGVGELSDSEKEKLSNIVKGLKERPKLLLEINGSYDPQMDWKAIKTKVFNQDYEQLRNDSKRTEAWVYQRLYERRFGVRQLWALAKKYRSKDGVLDEAKFQEDMKHQVIEDAPPNQVAMNALAETRAKNVYDFILAVGFDAQRVSIGQSHSTMSSMGNIPLEFTLTIFDSQGKGL